jgi:hypothetical protein
MHIYLSIGPINFDFSALLSFIIGIGFGFLSLLLIYLYAVIKSLNKGLKLRSADEQDIDEEEIKMLIKDAQAEFKNKQKRISVGYAKHLGNITKELTMDIAKKFFPKSKHPYLELTIDETLKLNHYITDRLAEIMKGKIFNLTRGWTISKIVEMNETKTKIEHSAVVVAAKKYSKVTTAAVQILNIANPVYWMRKLTIDKVVNAITLQIGLALIAVTGEETYKIYSKKVFNVEPNIETNIDQIYLALNKELKDAGENS